MKKRFGLLIVIGLCNLWTFAYVYAQIDALTFFIPYPADLLDDQLDVAHSDNFIDVDIVTTISISVQRDSTLIYYDHWEDGLEPNLTSPIQATTEIWGDGDPSNGFSPGFPGDVFSQGDVIILQNTVVVPRNPDDLFFDGGDKIVSVNGGGIAVTLAIWPDTAGVVFAGAWELYPTSRWGTSYVIPVGEDVPRPNGGFATVGLNVQAVEDDTSVQLDLDADGGFEQTVVLNQGEHFTQVNGIRLGAQVQASAPVQVHLFTGDPADISPQYEGRAYTMLPRYQWSDDYLAPRSSNGDYWLYNPDPNSQLEVEVQTIVGTTVITAPANGFANYNPGLATGARFTSTNGRPFYGVAALDFDYAQDWGYALLPTDSLTNQAFIGWAPGNSNTPPDGDESRVYATATTTSTIFIDYDNDGAPDADVLILPLAETPITDPDHNLTGARLYTTNGTPFMAVWGQDENAIGGEPSIDLGTNIVPLSTVAIQKTYTLIEEGYNCGPVSRGHTIQFRLQVYNDSVDSLTDVIARDELPPDMAYIPHSTRVGGTPIPDNSNGTPFPLDEAGYNIGDIDSLGIVSIVYDVVIQGSGLFVNQAEIVSPATDSAMVNMWLPLREIGYDVTKAFVDPPNGSVTTGQVITFGLTITNTGSLTITTLPLQDIFDENYLTFYSTSVTPAITTPGLITWTDLTTVLGDLPSNTPANLLVSFIVNPIPPGVISTTNVVLSEGTQNSAGRPQAIMCDEVSVNFMPPAEPPAVPPPQPPTPTPSPEPSDSLPSVTPTPTSSPPPPSPTPVPTPVIRFLPETGEGPPATGSLRLLLVFPVPGLLLFG